MSRKRELTPKRDFYCHFHTDCCVMWVISPDWRSRERRGGWGRGAASGDPRPIESPSGEQEEVVTFRLGLRPSLSQVHDAFCLLVPLRGSRWSLLNQADHQLESTLQ